MTHTVIISAPVSKPEKPRLLRTEASFLTRRSNVANSDAILYINDSSISCCWVCCGWSNSCLVDTVNLLDSESVDASPFCHLLLLFGFNH